MYLTISQKCISHSFCLKICYIGHNIFLLEKEKLIKMKFNPPKNAG